VSYAGARDVGAVAAIALTTAVPKQQALDLTGAEAIDHFEVARGPSEVLGRRIDYARLSAAEFARAELREGETLPFVFVMAGILRCVHCACALGRAFTDH
jgi:uncharacterized protein YbjT (DUF2867 family)